MQALADLSTNVEILLERYKALREENLHLKDEV